jgi:sulfate adenylyltransferase (ADP) / ATP adenylyltransferase
MTRRQRQNVVRPCFVAGTLLDLARQRAARALHTGALEPIETQSTYLDDRGIPFLVRMVANLRRKPRGNAGRNPFLPYETALHVADVTPTHVCILNKYNVVDLHLLIITRLYEDQESPLHLADFQALWRCMGEFDSLGFYNSGTTSGASQPHKHLQIVPLPLSERGNGTAVPVEPLLDPAGARPGAITQLDTLPFAHAIVFWPPSRQAGPDAMAQQACEQYRHMLRHLNLTPDPCSDQRVSGAYNLLVTDRWMLVIPRVAECFRTVSLNSLAFAGALLVRAPRQFEQLRAAGPLAALEFVAAPKSINNLRGKP